jgi:hypothetical protein
MIGRGALAGLLAAAGVVVGPRAARSQTPAAAADSGERSQCNLLETPTTRITTDSASGAAYVGGGVKIRCPSRGILLLGDSAQRLVGQYYVIGHVIYDEPRVHLTSDYLTYFLADERVVATSNVHARLPNGSTLDGPVLTLLRADAKLRRPLQQIIATGRPTITVASKDSTGKPEPPTKIVGDHVFMDGDSLIYGGGSVVMTNQDVNATADSAFIDEPHEVTHLMRNPKVTGKKDRPFSLAGDLIDLYSKDRKLVRVLARARAVAVSDSMTLKSDTIDLRVSNDLLQHAYAWGAKSRARAESPSQNLLADSLDVTMPDQHVQLVRAVRKAYAEGKPDTTRFEVEKGDSTDRLLGDTIIAHFDTATPPPTDTSKAPAIKQLVADGHAAAYYHMAPSDSSQHRAAINYVQARVVQIDFDKQHRVSTVATRDSVTGIFIEPSDTTTKSKPGTSSGQSGNGKLPKSIVPLPVKRPP